MIRLEIPEGQTFPWVRPEDVAAMTEPERLDLLAQLAKDMRGADVRQRKILAAREQRREAAAVAEAERLAAVRAVAGFTAAELSEGERVLFAHRELVRQGLRHGDGTRMDDLRAARAAVRAGSTNPYLRALNREYSRLDSARRRQTPERRAS